MCELLGASFRRKMCVREYLSAFFNHAQNHPHGWGILYEKYGTYETLKEPMNACESELAQSVVQQIEPQKQFLAHIRFATAGAIKYENCHPFQRRDFSGRTWTLIHNGTIYSDKKTLMYREKQAGNTDSERLLLYLIDILNAAYAKTGTPLTEQQRFLAVDKLVCNMSERNKLNLLIFDGEVLYAHKNMKGTLYYTNSDDGFLFSTHPISHKNWAEFPDTQLFAFKNGRKSFSGTKHDNIFVSNLQYITELDAMNI